MSGIGLNSLWLDDLLRYIVIQLEVLKGDLFVIRNDTPLGRQTSHDGDGGPKRQTRLEQ